MIIWHDRNPQVKKRTVKVGFVLLSYGKLYFHSAQETSALTQIFLCHMQVLLNRNKKMIRTRMMITTKVVKVKVMANQIHQVTAVNILIFVLVILTFSDISIPASKLSSLKIKKAVDDDNSEVVEMRIEG